VTWSAQRDALGLPAGGTQLIANKTSGLHQLPGDERDIRVFNPADWPSGSPLARYAALVQLPDASWLLFSSPERSWGLDIGTRIAIIIALV
jgi:two-component system osmolarity sensor histidine kinase EnvZ